MSPIISRRTLIAAAIVLAAGLPLAHGPAAFAAEPVKVGSKIDTEARSSATSSSPSWTPTASRR